MVRQNKVFAIAPGRAKRRSLFVAPKTECVLFGQRDDSIVTKSETSELLECIVPRK